PIDSYSELVRALERRRVFFRRMGAMSTDHGVVEPYTERLSVTDAQMLFQRGCAGQATAADQRRWEAHLLMEMARMSSEDGLVLACAPGVAPRAEHARCATARARARIRSRKARVSVESVAALDR